MKSFNAFRVFCVLDTIEQSYELYLNRTLYSVGFLCCLVFFTSCLCWVQIITYKMADSGIAVGACRNLSLFMKGAGWSVVVFPEVDEVVAVGGVGNEFDVEDGVEVDLVKGFGDALDWAWGYNALYALFGVAGEAREFDFVFGIDYVAVVVRRDEVGLSGVGEEVPGDAGEAVVGVGAFVEVFAVADECGGVVADIVWFEVDAVFFEFGLDVLKPGAVVGDGVDSDVG